MKSFGVTLSNLATGNAIDLALLSGVAMPTMWFLILVSHLEGQDACFDAVDDHSREAGG